VKSGTQNDGVGWNFLTLNGYREGVLVISNENSECGRLRGTRWLIIY